MPIYMINKAKFQNRNDNQVHLYQPLTTEDYIGRHVVRPIEASKNESNNIIIKAVSLMEFDLRITQK